MPEALLADAGVVHAARAAGDRLVCGAAVRHIAAFPDDARDRGVAANALESWVAAREHGTHTGFPHTGALLVSNTIACGSGDSTISAEGGDCARVLPALFPRTGTVGGGLGRTDGLAAVDLATVDHRRRALAAAGRYAHGACNGGALGWCWFAPHSGARGDTLVCVRHRLDDPAGLAGHRSHREEDLGTDARRRRAADGTVRWKKWWRRNG